MTVDLSFFRSPTAERLRAEGRSEGRSEGIAGSICVFWSDAAWRSTRRRNSVS
ncbi:hypothetical protein ACPESR_31825 [Nocardia testacea]|uniref:hypothetical protein n=1 Tax=Nocardia testacea TaxID=248551 RepID=UPI003C2CD450